MKTKIILASFLIFFIASVNESVFAESFYCERLDYFCKQEGLLHDLTRADEEFKMLLEPTYHPNFREMLRILNVINCAYESEEHMNILLHNPSCSVSKYTQKLLKFYNDNKEKIIENINREVPRELRLNKDDLKTLSTFDQFVEKIHKELPIEKDEL